MTRALAISLTCHLLVLGSLFISLGREAMKQRPTGEANGPNGANHQLIVPRAIDITVLQPHAFKHESPVVVKDKPKSKGVKQCEGTHWYGGIGIEQAWRDHSVLSVSPGYPAERAGIKVGDVIVSTNEITGDPGTMVKVDVYRPSTAQILTFNMMRDKVCTGEEAKP